MSRISNPIAAPDNLLAFTGQALDVRAALQANQQRHFDATVVQWISDQPIAFRAGDADVFRYVDNPLR